MNRLTHEIPDTPGDQDMTFSLPGRARALEPTYYPAMGSLPKQSRHFATHEAEQFGRLYTIVVHGTRLGGEDSTWWRRDARNEFDFCPMFENALAECGVHHKVFQHCEDFNVNEFSWSGLNQHDSRLEAGRSLADYVNDLHRRCVETFGQKPLFAFVGHSHGGNVALSAQRHLLDDVRVLSIDCLGTPFFVYHFKPQSERAQGQAGPKANLYVHSELSCLSLRNWTTRRWDGAQHLFDEVELLFLGLHKTRYLEHEIEAALRGALAADDAAPAGGPAWSLRMLRGPSGAAEDVYLESQFVDLPPRSTLRRYRWRAGSRLIKRFAIRRAARWLSKSVSDLLYRQTTGLDPQLYPPQHVEWWASPGIAYPGQSSGDVPLDSRERHVLAIESNPSDARGDLMEVMLRSIGLRARSLVAEFEFIHSSYYRNPKLIAHLASSYWRDLVDYYPHLVAPEHRRDL